MKKIFSVILALSLMLVMFNMTGLAATGDTYLDFEWIEQTDIAEIADVMETYDYDIVLTLDMLHNPGTTTVGGFIEYDHNDVEIVPMTGVDADDQVWRGARAKTYAYCEFAPNFLGDLDRGYFLAAKTTAETRLGNLFHVMFKIKTSAKKATTISFAPDVENCVDKDNIKVPVNQERYSISFNLNGYDPDATYALTFDKNTTDSVDGMPSNTTYKEGDAVSLAGTPTRTGYSFKGWSTDGTTKLDSFTMPAAATTLYAVWEQDAVATYTLTYAKGTSDDVTGVPAAAEYEAGAAVSLAAVPFRVGYTFLGWSEDGTTTLNSYNMPAAPATLTALWELNENEVIINDPTSTKEGLKEIQDDWGNVIRSEVIPMLPHFGTLRGIQVPTGATSTDATTTVRLIVGINSLEYLKAGFIVAAQSNLNKDGYTPGDEFSKEITSKSVYTAITANGVNYTAEDFGAKYLVVVEIANFPQAAYGYNVRFQGFAVTYDGVYHFDTFNAETIKTVNSLFVD